jgi:CBS domain-containing protein
VQWHNGRQFEAIVETAAIRYRVAEFLKKQPPFHAIEEADLLQFAGQGTVKFYEANQYIVSQGASRYQIHVLQQGTVSLWDERGPKPQLLDVRGAGDMLGVDQLRESRVYPYSATSRSDVLAYSFPKDDFWRLVEKYPEVADYIAAYVDLAISVLQPRANLDPQDIALRDVVRDKLRTCDSQTSVRDVARYLLSSGQDATAVLDQEQRVRGIVSLRSLVQWIANGGEHPEQPIEALLKAATPIIADASVADAVLAMEGANGDALAITSDGTLDGSFDAIVTRRSFGEIFGDQPGEILRDIKVAHRTRALCDLNQRVRKFALRYLYKASSTDWLTRFTSAADAEIVKRIIAIAAPERIEGCWCFCGTSGRGEALPALAPEIVLITNDDRASGLFHRALEALGECGYLQSSDRPFESSFYVASLDEWKERYLDWVRDPVLKKIYLAHAFFDLRPIYSSAWQTQSLEATLLGAVGREFLHILANDCLSTLPPLTFFQNAVLDESGTETAILKLEETALRPLVDVGRVFGLATHKVFCSSTLERFEMAESAWPEHATIFREAAKALRIVLWQQGRVGLTEGTMGWDLPPALLGPYDRQLLKNCFRSIMRLIEFTGNFDWLKAL